MNGEVCQKADVRWPLCPIPVKKTSDEVSSASGTQQGNRIVAAM